MTLEPGIYDPSEAPWWRFTSPEVTDTTRSGTEDMIVVVKQWMNQAAEVFALEISKRCAGGEVELQQLGMSLDGMTGHYICHFQLLPTHPVPLTVRRGEQTMEPKDGSQLQADR